jgi:hypothetical protein
MKTKNEKEWFSLYVFIISFYAFVFVCSKEMSRKSGFFVNLFFVGRASRINRDLKVT